MGRTQLPGLLELIVSGWAEHGTPEVHCVHSGSLQLFGLRWGQEKGDHGWKHLEKEKAGTGRGMKMHKGLIDFSLQRETALSIMFFLN